jgi:ketosteroid isomerase-like protein
MPGFSLRYTPVMAEVGGGADLGYTIGTYHLTLPDEAGNIVAIDGKYLTEWRRQPDGAWKYEVDMFNADGPPVPVSEKEE